MHENNWMNSIIKYHVFLDYILLYLFTFEPGLRKSTKKCIAKFLSFLPVTVLLW